MPISWQARWIRSAISPRLAIRSFLIGISGAQPTITSGWSNSTGWASATMIFLTTPPLGAVIGFMTFIASMISKVSPALTLSPTAMNGLAARLGREESGADHRRLDGFAGDFFGGGSRLARTAPRALKPARGCGSAPEATELVAGDADHAVAVGDLDLGQRIFGQELGQLAHQLGIDAHRGLGSLVRTRDRLGGLSHAEILY